MERSYTVAEIDRMREAVRTLSSGGYSVSAIGYSYRPADDAVVESKLRTYMAGGVDPQELFDMETERRRWLADRMEAEKVLEQQDAEARMAEARKAQKPMTVPPFTKLTAEPEPAPKRPWYAFWA